MTGIPKSCPSSLHPDSLITATPDASTPLATEYETEAVPAVDTSRASLRRWPPGAHRCSRPRPNFIRRYPDKPALVTRTTKSALVRSVENNEQLKTQDLLLTLAWLLDTFLEIHVPDWKTVMKDPNRKYGHAWFWGTKLKIRHVRNMLQVGGSTIPVSDRLLHDHITAAMRIILRHWQVVETLRTKEKKCVYLTLFGLIQATLESCRSDEILADIQLDEPRAVARSLIEVFPPPTGLSHRHIQQFINHCWE
jgi:hypothetical protein